MKPTFFRFSILVLSIALGVSVSVFLRNVNYSVYSIPPIEKTPAIERFSYPPVNSVVISIPAEGEFYIGKYRFTLSEIGEVGQHTLSSIPNGERVAYIKPAVGIKAETLGLVMKELKLVGVERIELVIDKKKAAPRDNDRS